MGFPPCPDSLKAIAHYLKIADEHDTRDIVVSYWCRLHALEIGMKIAVVRTAEINTLLLSLMDWLEKAKTEYADNEGIKSKVCAQATVENYALKLFKYADEQDRAENFGNNGEFRFGRNVVKAFYTSGILMDVLTVFGELSEDIIEKRKYAKWKAAYIHNCLKAGEKPVPGPMENEDNDDDFAPVQKNNPNTNSFLNSPGKSGISNPPAWNMFPSVPQHQQPESSTFVPPPHVTPTTPTPQPTTPVAIPSSSITSTDPEVITKAQKYCKWASSALNYDDVKNAIDNLEKALSLLQTGKEISE